MKRFSVVSFILISATTIFAAMLLPLRKDVIADVAAAIKSGNASSVAAYFNSSLDLTVPGNDGTYSKSQAELILKDFFSSNPPKSFSISHQGSSNDGSQYGIGSYVTASSSYRAYFLMKKSGSSFLIQKLEFEED